MKLLLYLPKICLADLCVAKLIQGQLGIERLTHGSNEIWRQSLRHARAGPGGIRMALFKATDELDY